MESVKFTFPILSFFFQTCSLYSFSYFNRRKLHSISCSDQKKSTLVSYCFLNYHKLEWLKIKEKLFSYSSGSQKLKIKMATWLYSFWSLQGRILAFYSCQQSLSHGPFLVVLQLLLPLLHLL